MSKTADRGFKLQLPAINRTSTHVQQDYSIDEYDAVDDAVEGTQPFIEMFSQRVREGSILPSAPKIGGSARDD